MGQEESLSTPSKKGGGKAGPSSKPGKGKKKDADLFESEIVTRWNRGELVASDRYGNLADRASEIGDVCAASSTVKA